MIADPAGVDAEARKELHRGADVAQTGHVMDDDRLGGEHRGHHDGQCGVLAAAQVNDAAQGKAAVNDHFVHAGGTGGG